MTRNNLRRPARWLRARFGRPDNYVAACAAADIEAGQIRRVTGLPMVLCRTAARLYAVALTCPHAGAQLSRGRLIGDCLECPRHSARFALDQDFALEQDTMLAGGTLALRAYDVKVSDGIVYVSRRPHHHVYGRWDDDVPTSERHAAEDSTSG
jgi:nitrite reductase/ring-hydroxylating ferredoxin subunit